MVLITMLSFIRKHPIGVGSGAMLAVLGLAWLAFGYFGVQTLFIDDVVEEAGPVFDAAPVGLETGGATAVGSSAADQEPTSTTTPGPADDSAADSPADSPAESPDDATDDVSVEPAEAPDPTVPTTEAAAEPAEAPEIVTEYQGVFESDAHPTAGNAVVLGNGTGQRFLRLENFETDNGPDLNVYLVNSSTGDVSDYIDLGDLKGNIGDQNYEIPADVDLDVYDEVVIWCVRFSVGFGDALLTPA